MLALFKSNSPQNHHNPSSQENLDVLLIVDLESLEAEERRRQQEIEAEERRRRMRQEIEAARTPSSEKRDKIENIRKSSDKIEQKVLFGIILHGFFHSFYFFFSREHFDYSASCGNTYLDQICDCRSSDSRYMFAPLIAVFGVVLYFVILTEEFDIFELGKEILKTIIKIIVCTALLILSIFAYLDLMASPCSNFSAQVKPDEYCIMSPNYSTYGFLTFSVGIGLIVLLHLWSFCLECWLVYDKCKKPRNT